MKQRRAIGGGHGRGVTLAVILILLVPFVFTQSPEAISDWTLIGWNNFGMQWMDSDFSALSISPPYNTIQAQLIGPDGKLVTNPTGVTVTYEAIADPNGSFNSTSQGKTNFWQYVLPLFGVPIPPDMGLAGSGMPTSANVPQPMRFDALRPWFIAEGIPITPFDDAHNRNSYPLMRLVAKNTLGAALAATDIVLPVADEMDCKACHASGSNFAAEPPSGWVRNPDPQRDVRLNILLLHDAVMAGHRAYKGALATAGYNPSGLFATVQADGRPILCARCHASEVLSSTGVAGVLPLTEAIHDRHEDVLDPLRGLFLDEIKDRSACYRCHTGAATQFLRGVMGNAVSPDGTRSIQCQSCHGSIRTVATPGRRGWLDEPNCQNCHTGTAARNNGQIRYTSVFDALGNIRQAVDQTFATNLNTPGPGLSLYRFSRGHGGLNCEGCHGSTHAEFPTSQPNDNIQSIERQGHVGVLAECNTCHALPTTINGGPHGLHPIGQSWVDSHRSAATSGGTAPCQMCHGVDYRGTVLSRSQTDRTLTTSFGVKQFWRGFQVGCYNCHKGPNDKSVNPNHAPVVSNISAATSADTPITMGLSGVDADGDLLSFRIVSQSAHGTVGLSGTLATYFPDPNYAGPDSFTFAAWDGATGSNLGRVFLNITSLSCVTGISPTTVPPVPASGGSGSVTVTAPVGCGWTAQSDVSWITITSGQSGSGNGTVNYRVAPNTATNSRAGNLAIGGETIEIGQFGVPIVPRPDLTGNWVSLRQICVGPDLGGACGIAAKLLIQNRGTLKSLPVLVTIHLSSTSTVGADQLLIKQLKISSLKPGKEVIKNLKIVLPGGVNAIGKHIIAWIDPIGALIESNKNNNQIHFGPLVESSAQ